MERRCEEYVEALGSGDADRVNEVIDAIGEEDLGGRARLFANCFDDVASLYADSDDGYVRQSTVRVAERFAPGLAIAVGLDDDARSTDVDEGLLAEQTDVLCGFLLEAITDGDGRVRQSAGRGLQEVFRTYDALDDRETLRALIAELDEMADDCAGARRKHVLEAREEAEFCLQQGYAHMLDGLREEGDRDA